MTLFEQVVLSRSFQIVAGLLGIVVVIISAGFLIASRQPMEREPAVTRAAPTNLPILRSLKATSPTVRGVLAAPPAAEKQTARR